MGFSRVLPLVRLAIPIFATAFVAFPAVAGPRFRISFPPEMSREPLTGRLVLVFSPGGEQEPRQQVTWDADAIPFFGVDVEDWEPGEKQVIDRKAFGFPIRSLDDLPAGGYRVQAMLNRYETFTRSDGWALSLPPDQGEGQVWSRKPGNLYSKPQPVRIERRRGGRVSIVLDQKIPPVEPFEKKENEYVRYLHIRSERLSKFWGRDMYLGAWVRLPRGFEQHPEARYPLVIAHGHFPAEPFGFRDTPPDPDLKPEYSKRFRLEGYNRIQQEYAWQSHQDWITTGFPRVLLVEIQHPTPYYDDSYAVNSANNGPFGDAIQYELIPAIEKRFRGLGTGWSRFVYGGSTGGWEAMAVQMFYPDDYNGAWIACPDPIDFQHYVLVDIYKDKNAYFTPNPYKRTPRPAHRNWLGQVDTTIEEQNLYELTLGTHGRSGDQWDAWESVYSPVGPDGYPRRIWDRLTGEVDPITAAYWREHYDLAHMLRRDWATLGPKLRGKLRIYTGDMDNYFLNNAVYGVEEFLKNADPPADAVIEYGDRQEHCWNGDHTRANAYSRLRYPQMVLPWVVERILDTAPPDADIDSWRY
ncbi:MAG: hypothetical protein ACREQZ_01250 [Woeseiaceae bacterium]